MCRYDDNPAEFLTDRISRARKEHKCDECARTIKPGEQYEYTFGKWDGWVDVIKTCQHCLAAREWLATACMTWTYHDVLGELVEHWDEEYDLRSVQLGRLIIGMRRRWRDGADPIPNKEQVRLSVPERARAA